MQWFKFFGAEYLIDPKMQTLTASERSCWLTLLCYASAAEDNGRIRYLTEDKLLLQAGILMNTEEWKATVGVLKHFESLDMVLLESNGDVTVSNWSKRQNTYLTNAERQARYRERQKSNANVTPVYQQSNARIDREIERKKDASKEAGNANADSEQGDIQRIAAKITKSKEVLRSKKII